MADLFDIDRTARISELVTLIKKYQKSYYNGESEISDFEFDKISLISDCVNLWLNSIFSSKFAIAWNIFPITFLKPIFFPYLIKTSYVFIKYFLLEKLPI